MATLLLERSGPLTGDLSVTVNTVPGVATVGDFKALVNVVVVIPAGRTRALVQVPLMEDAAFEPGESFTVTLSNPTGGAFVAYPMTRKPKASARAFS